ncbi:hypothetical protein, partial [Burkholderia metallica]|uniref:hypothetical protein n=1 Tax=Burkholderia metallica TaxID=488729 RepID=UPI001A8F09EB
TGGGFCIGAVEMHARSGRMAWSQLKPEAGYRFLSLASTGAKVAKTGRASPAPTSDADRDPPRKLSLSAVRRERNWAEQWLIHPSSQI